MNKYISHKTVEAFKIISITLCADGVSLAGENGNGDSVVVNDDYMQRNKPQVGGYYVQYKDGFQSWSPAKAFEEGYSIVKA